MELTVAAARFDMDGTLVDSTAVVESLWLQFCSEHRVDPAVLLAYSHGRRTPDIVRRFLPDASTDRLRSVTTELERRELEADDGIREVPGAAALLGSLRLPWAVVTSAPRVLAVRRLVAAGLPVPEVLVPADEVTHGKPAPDGYLRAAALLGVEPHDSVAFEDAEPGVRSALDAGARVVVVGDLEAPVTSGLQRVRDLTTVTLRRR
ncbi:HAD-IA family hydrolase [Nocardioides cynanchi]|uniref:HAD-IA family hydrolase n=1 Tax=Nocardioides cynanchi TaxID=2558918 RepID=UPI00192D8DBA|nr:HAD-IA family hydrolase [Nocardioides cynanchi]